MRKQHFLKLTALIVVLLMAVSTTALAEDMSNTDMAAVGMKTEAGYIDVTPDEALQLIRDNPDLVIIDVSPLYDESHLPGALHYFVGDGTLDNAIPMLDKTKTYLVYCHTDEASMLGAGKLVQAGFDPVYRLQGNFGGWVEAGFPVSTLTVGEEILLNSTAAMGTRTEAGFIDISPDQVKALAEAIPSLVIVDVSPIYNDGHLPGAVNYYVGDGTLDNAIPMLDMNVPYVVYCHTDAASHRGRSQAGRRGVLARVPAGRQLRRLGERRLPDRITILGTHKPEKRRPA